MDGSMMIWFVKMHTRLMCTLRSRVKLQNKAVAEFELGQRWIRVDNKPD